MLPSLVNMDSVILYNIIFIQQALNCIRPYHFWESDQVYYSSPPRQNGINP